MNKPKHKLKKLALPPKTRRYCLICRKKTIFEYNRGRGHSECVECGCFDARKLIENG